MKTSEILERAADICEAGWMKGYYVSSTPDGHCFCVLGALRMAGGGELTGPPLSISSSGGHIDALRTLEREVGRSVADWNDAPGRTQSEVIAKLREVAAAEREAGR